MTIKLSDSETGRETVWTISEKSIAVAAIATAVGIVVLLCVL